MDKQEKIDLIKGMLPPEPFELFMRHHQNDPNFEEKLDQFVEYLQSRSDKSRWQGTFIQQHMDFLKGLMAEVKMLQNSTTPEQFGYLMKYAGHKSGVFSVLVEAVKKGTWVDARSMSFQDFKNMIDELVSIEKEGSFLSGLSKMREVLNRNKEKLQPQEPPQQMAKRKYIKLIVGKANEISK